MKKTVTVYYRKLSRENSAFPADQSLEDVLTEAIDSVQSDWQDRAMDTGSDSTHFVNEHKKLSKGLYGDLCAFSDSQRQAVISTNQGANQSSVPVQEMRAPKGSDFLLGMAYWLVVDDHVLLIQGATLLARQIEEYFDWLLRKNTRIISDDKPVLLTAIFDADEIGEPDEFKSIEVGGAVASNISAEKIATQSKLVEASKWAGDIFQLIFGEEQLANLKRDLPEESQLKANVTFRFPRRRRKKDVDINFQHGLIGALQDLPDSQIKVRSKDGVISKNDARLQMRMRVEKMHENSVLLDQGDASITLYRVYSRFMEDEKIS